MVSDRGLDLLLLLGRDLGQDVLLAGRQVHHLACPWYLLLLAYLPDQSIQLQIQRQRLEKGITSPGNMGHSREEFQELGVSQLFRGLWRLQQVHGGHLGVAIHALDLALSEVWEACDRLDQV